MNPSGAAGNWSWRSRMLGAAERRGGTFPQSCQILPLIAAAGCCTLRFSLSLSLFPRHKSPPPQQLCQNKPAQLSPSGAGSRLHPQRASPRSCPCSHTLLSSQATFEAAAKPKGKRQHIATPPVFRRRRRMGKRCSLPERQR